MERKYTAKTHICINSSKSSKRPLEAGQIEIPTSYFPIGCLKFPLLSNGNDQYLQDKITW